MLKRYFTLIELVVVLAIMMLLTGIAISALRSETPDEILDRNVREIETYIARVRYQCAEKGRDYVVHFYPEKKLFCAHVDYSEAELENLAEDISESRHCRNFIFSENVDVLTVEGAEEDFMENDYVEIFRFYPSGGAVCINRPCIRIGEKSRFMDISFLTGQLLVDEGNGDGVEKK